MNGRGIRKCANAASSWYCLLFQRVRRRCTAPQAAEMPPFGLIAWPVMRTACATSLASAAKNSTWAAGARARTAGDQYSAFRKGARMRPGLVHNVALPFWSRLIHDERERAGGMGVRDERRSNRDLDDKLVY